MYTFDQICETSKDGEGKQKGTFSFVADTFRLNLLDLRHVQLCIYSEHVIDRKSSIN